MYLLLVTLLISAFTCLDGGFVEYPSNITLLFESETVAAFRCRHQSIDAVIVWRVNGSSFGVFPGANTFTVNTDSTPVYTLTIPVTIENNQTEVVCQAPLLNETTPPAKLFVMQGPLQSVTDLVRNANTLSWDAPFSLNLTNADPDIVYCVEVYNITCGRRDLIISDCNVTEPSYTSDDIALDGYIYEYTITPRSNVEGASNGTSQPVTEEFIQLSESAMGQRVTLMTNNNTMATLYLDIISGSRSQNSVIPAAYSISLNSLDGLEDNGGFMVNATENTRSSVTLKLPSLTFRRVWNTTVFACCCENHSLVTNIELGTHDIYDISVDSSPDHGVVIVTGDIINGSSSTGALIIVYSLTTDSNVYYNFTRRPVNQLRLHTMIPVMGLPVGQYQVTVFVMKESGLPFPRAAATPRQVQFQGTFQGSNTLPIEYVLVSNSTSVCITCTFLDSSTTDCVAVIHQRISQLNSSGLMNIESSHKFNRSGDTAYGCIEEVNLADYQVGVVGGILIVIVEVTGSQVNVIVGSTVVVLVLVASVTVGGTVTIYIIYKRKKRKNKGSIHPQVHIPSKSEAASSTTTPDGKDLGHSQGQTYALLGATASPMALGMVPDDLHKTEAEYSTIQHNTQRETSLNEAEYSKLKHKGMGDTEATGKVLDKSEYSTLQGQEEEESFTKGARIVADRRCNNGYTTDQDPFTGFDVESVSIFKSIQDHIVPEELTAAMDEQDCIVNEDICSLNDQKQYQMDIHHTASRNTDYNQQLHPAMTRRSHRACRECQNTVMVLPGSSESQLDHLRLLSQTLKYSIV